MKSIQASRNAGFSLVEVLLALALGTGLFGVILKTLFLEARHSGQLVRLLREKAFQRRTMDLIASDLSQASGINVWPEWAEPACALAGRAPVLHLETGAGPITYSVGRPPSEIWRGQVLMRCGPAYGLDGTLRSGSTATNRVVIDGLIATGAEAFRAKLEPSNGVIVLQLRQSFAARDKNQSIGSQCVLDLTGIELL